MEKARKFRLLGKGEKWIGGVCAGLAYWVGIQVWIMRLVWLWVFIFLGFGVIPYIIFWAFVPRWKETPEDFGEITGD